MPTPDGSLSTSQFGPFRDQDVSIYCDESRHEGQSEQRFMVIGGLWMPRNRRRQILEELHKIRVEHRIVGELKWTKLSRKRLLAYQALVDHIAGLEDVHFRCIVVDKTKVDADKFFQSDKQLGFWVFYWHCLKQWMGNRNTYVVNLDFKPEGLRSGPTRLKEILQNAILGRAWIRSLECVNSKVSPFCQIADMLVGAVGYQQNGLSESKVKSDFCTHVANAFRRQDLRGSDLPSVARFNIFKIWS
jgi:hypothetical protein